jgi:8-oxo-dGTP diphosphatase
VRERPSARLIVLDPQGRVLLFLFHHREGPLAGIRFWATPGGSLEPGESYAQAATRELFEETGIAADVGEEIGRGHAEFMMPDGETVTADERYFLVRTSDQVDPSANPDPLERSVMADMRWWPLDEIANAAEPVFPENLVEMVRASPVA